MCKYIVVVIVLAAIALPLIRKKLHESRMAPEDVEVGTVPRLSRSQLESEFSGKNILLVGGTRGIGLGTALVLAQVGAHITLVGRSPNSGATAVRQIEAMAKNYSKNIQVKFIQGDFGTVKDSIKAVDNILQEKLKYDHLVVSIGVFPDWDDPFNADGILKPVAIANIGRYILFKDAEKFLQPNARILNILFSGVIPDAEERIDRDLFSGKKNFSNLFHSFIVGVVNDVINVEFESRWSKNDFKIIGTAPGWITTELHTGQGFLFDRILFPLFDTLAAYPLLEIGEDNVNFLATKKITKKLTFVDEARVSRVISENLRNLHKKDGAWLIEFIEGKIASNKGK